MTTIWNIVLAMIGSIGGAGIIISGVVKFSSNIIANKLQQKYELKLTKEIEKYKSNLDNKNYISKTRFDAEFQIYRELSEATLTMCNATYMLFPDKIEIVPADKVQAQNYYLNKHNNAYDAVANAQKIIRANAPFIPEDFFNKFDELSIICLKQVNYFTFYSPYPQKIEGFIPRNSEQKECLQNSKLILEKEGALIKELRKYLTNLEVSEN